MGYGDVKIKSNSKFLKIESGQPHDIRLLNESPVETYKHQSEAGPIICKGDMCPNCVDGDEVIQKFITNVYDHNEKKVMLWEYGGGVAKQLMAIAKTLDEEQRSILTTDLKVDATGSGMKKRYNVTPRLTAKPIPEGLNLHKIETGDVPF